MGCSFVVPGSVEVEPVSGRGAGSVSRACGSTALCGADELAGQVGAAGRFAADHQDGVVAGDGAHHTRGDAVVVRVVDGRGEELGGSGWGAQHHQVGRALRGDQQFAEQPLEPGLQGAALAGDLRGSVAALAAQRVDQGTVPVPDADRAEFVEVAGEGGLGDRVAVLGEQFGERGLRAHLVLAEQVGDPLVTRAAGVDRGQRAQRGLGVGFAGHRRGPSGAVELCSMTLCSIKNVSSAFWACRRFSASSQTTDCGPSITDAAISLPRYAGRQCSTIASGAPSARAASSRAYGLKTSARSLFSASWPIDTHVSVTSTSASVAAALASCSTWTEPPVSAAIRSASATIAGSGR